MPSRSREREAFFSADRSVCDVVEMGRFSGWLEPCPWSGGVSRGTGSDIKDFRVFFTNLIVVDKLRVEWTWIDRGSPSNPVQSSSYIDRVNLGESIYISYVIQASIV